MAEHERRDRGSGSVVLIGGGVRCGKSAFALERAAALGTRRAFVATAQAGDEEMARRIARHRRERGSDFTTIEEPVELVARLSTLYQADVVVVDCLTLWLANLLLRDEPEAAILARIDALCGMLARRDLHAVIVTNEVGMGLVPDTPLGRSFRDLSGLAHQRIARIADEIYFGALGAMLRLRPAPLALVPRGVPT